ncbi:MAG: hypothetical protein ACLQVI_04900 [Polyangiaceae bacterium]
MAAIAPAELAAALVKRAGEVRRRDEARRLEVLARTLEELGRLLAAGCASHAWIVGTVAWGGYGERSDVDVVLEGARASSRDALSARLTAACGAAVDLLLLEELDPSFQARVRAEGLAIDGA